MQQSSPFLAILSDAVDRLEYQKRIIRRGVWLLAAVFSVGATFAFVYDGYMWIDSLIMIASVFFFASRMIDLNKYKEALVVPGIIIILYGAFKILVVSYDNVYLLYAYLIVGFPIILYLSIRLRKFMVAHQLVKQLIKQLDLK